MVDLAGSLCCVVGQNDVLSECLSPTRIMNGWQQFSGKPDKMLGDNLAMD